VISISFLLRLYFVALINPLNLLGCINCYLCIDENKNILHRAASY